MLRFEVVNQRRKMDILILLLYVEKRKIIKIT